jgi:hypothetical protein
MNPNLSDFTAPQCEALLDLLVLATYLDQHPGMAEDVRVEGLLTAMGCATVIRSLTSGRGMYTLEPFDYQPVPESELKQRFGDLLGKSRVPSLNRNPGMQHTAFPEPWASETNR